MSLGLGDKLPILMRSPLDSEIPLVPAGESAVAEAGARRWLPSRYNIRATTTDGRLVLWNSLRGTLSVFPAALRRKVEILLTQKGFTAVRRGVVKLLHERGFLIQEGTDEYRRIQLEFGQAQYRTDVLELILLASEDCNFRCTYCYEDFARGTMQPAVRTAIKKLTESRIRSLSSLSVGWFGGEPLYGFEAIEDLAPFFLEIARAHSVRFSSYMTTNAFLLTPEVAERLLSWGVTSYQITLDGVPEDHNCSRPTRDGQETFGPILANLKALSRRSEDFKVMLRFNFDRNNVTRYRAFLDIVERELGGDPRFKMRFYAVGKWGGPNDAGLAVCGVDDAWDMEREMKKEARRRGLSLASEITEVGLGSHVCYAARPYNFLIGASGKVMKCTIDLDKHDRNVVGHLRPDGSMEIDRNKLARWTEPAFEQDSKCRQCVVLPACQGIYCPQVRMETGDPLCSPLRRYAKRELVDAVEGRSDATSLPLHGETAAAGSE